MGRWAQRVLGIAISEVDFERRGFPGRDQPVRPYLEEVGGSFVRGYSAALADDRLPALVAALEEVPATLRGFAYEGAGMALTLLDFFQPWRASRLASLVAGPGHPYRYLVFIGVGWGLARLPKRLDSVAARLDPLLGWLVFDGVGFHQAFFYPQETVYQHRVPRRVKGYGRRAFDHGVGRSLWFVEGAEPERIDSTIGRFSPERRADLWSGVGLASAYAGGVPPATFEALQELAGPYLPELAQGIAFAARSRLEVDAITPSTELACRKVWGLDPREVTRLTEEAGENLAATEGTPIYETWRRALQRRFRSERHESWTLEPASSAATA